MRASVRQRVTLIVTLSALLPLLVVWGITLLLSYRLQQNVAQQQQVTVTQLIANDFSSFIDDSERQLSIFASSLAESPQPEQLSEQELRALISGAIFTEVGLYTDVGVRQASLTRFGDAQQPESIAGTPLLSQVQQDQTFYGNPERLQVQSLPLSPDEVPRLRIAVPVQFDFDTRWVLIGDINMDQIWALTTDQEASTKTRVFILGNDGALISASQIQNLLDQVNIKDTPLVTGSETTVEYTSPLGPEVLGTRTTITPTNWTLVVERPQAEIYGDLQQLALSLLLVIIGALPVVVGVGWLAGRRIVRPIQVLHAGVETFANDPQSFTPIQIDTGGEMTDLGNAFNTMISTINQSRERLAEANAELEALVGTRTAELQQALVQVQHQNDAQQALLETVRRLSMPVIPIKRGMVVLPLVGDFTSARSADINTYLLQAVEEQKARVILIDITGLLSADEIVSRTLLDAATAVRLLGAEVILAGIRPDLAESLINVGVNLKGIRTAATLEQAFILGSTLLPQMEQGYRVLSTSQR